MCSCRIILAAIIVILFIVLIVPPEQVLFFYPRVDTKFSPTFNEKKFNQLKKGITYKEVQQLIGKPLSFDTLKYINDIYKFQASYSQDGACNWGDYAWLHVYVFFDNNLKVVYFGKEYNND